MPKMLPQPSEADSATESTRKQQASAEAAPRPIKEEQMAKIIKAYLREQAGDGFMSGWLTAKQWRELIGYCTEVWNGGVTIGPILRLHISLYMVTTASF